MLCENMPVVAGKKLSNVLEFGRVNPSLRVFWANETDVKIQIPNINLSLGIATGARYL